jgi:hypothetical protein
MYTGCSGSCPVLYATCPAFGGIHTDANLRGAKLNYAIGYSP